MADVGYGSYDSPTFLGRKDKLMLGLSLMQMMAVVFTTLSWFVVSLGFTSFSMLERFMFVVPAELATAVFLMVKPYGLYIPVYVWLMVKGLIFRQMYESEGHMLVHGMSQAAADAVLLNDDEPARGGLLGMLGRLGRKGGKGVLKGTKAVAGESQMKREVQTDAQRAAEEGARNLKQSVEQGMKMLLK